MTALRASGLTTPQRVAVVGAGFFSQFHLEGWRQLPGVELVGLCDADPARAQELARRFGIARVFTEVAHMLEATRPDLVDVVTPPASHAEVLGIVLSQKLPVICQKPFGTGYAQAVQLTDRAALAGVPLIVHENFRFMPWFREARRLVDAGHLGALHNVSFRLRPGDGQGPNAYLNRQPYFQTMPRLLVVETAIHLIDTFRYLMGEVQAVYARLRRLNPAIEGEDAGLITFDFSSGAAGLFDGNRLNDHVADNPRRTMGEMWLEGARGVLRLDGNANLWWKPHHGEEVPHLYDSGSALSFGGGACGFLQAHVLQCLAAGREPENTARAYLKNLLIQEAVYASDRSGQRITLEGFEPLNPTAGKGTAPGIGNLVSKQKKETV
ncbi:Gfo/Idh/MocA family protein [Polaromonas sp.]|uniref:Gfo/Idh/MocA family protein n=1 Tax=Polaromonas sp. TaxID=1869339 RepID=UPI00272F8211|nr:Gfo/Idh/MocA family oxidoreductase [Polaromonas sp.]MDP1740152.1 Gfo/Idh/MocA family oxidoreductase [Polaromonas sp.]